MNYKAVPYKPRKHWSITIAIPLFDKAIRKRDYETASKILVWNALILLGSEGLINALDNANRAIERKKYRKGL